MTIDALLSHGGNVRLHSIACTGLSKEELLRSLQTNKIKLNAYAEQLFSSDRFVVQDKPSIQRIIVLSVRDLGFQQGAPLDQLFNGAAELDLMECPLDTGPYFRLHYRDQEELNETEKNKPPLGSITVLSKPLSYEDDFPKGFYLRKIEGSLWLRGYLCSRDYVWNPDDQIALMMR